MATTLFKPGDSQWSLSKKILDRLNVGGGGLTGPRVQITVTVSNLFFVQGMGVDQGGLSVRPVLPIPLGTSTWALTEWTSGTAFLYAWAIAYADTMTEYNDNGGFGGSGGFMMLYESDDAPTVWEPQNIVTAQFIAMTPSFAVASAACIAANVVPITSMIGFQLPSP